MVSPLRPTVRRCYATGQAKARQSGRTVPMHSRRLTSRNVYHCSLACCMIDLMLLYYHSHSILPSSSGCLRTSATSSAQKTQLDDKLDHHGGKLSLILALPISATYCHAHIVAAGQADEHWTGASLAAKRPVLPSSRRSCCNALYCEAM
jgi:hypothetical protein